MRKIEQVTFILVSALFMSSCATLSNRQKTLITMGIAGTTAGIIGAAFTPEGENPIAHGALWGGGTAAIAGALSLYLFDEEGKRREAEARASKLDRELTEYREQSEPQLIGSNQVGLPKPLPDKFKNLVTPGQWSLYKVDRWVSTSDSELVHQDHIFRFSRPELNPAASLNPETKTGETHEK